MAVHYCTRHGRAGQYSTVQYYTGHGRAGKEWMGQDRTVQYCTGQGRSVQDRQGRVGRDRREQDRNGMV